MVKSSTRWRSEQAIRLLIVLLSLLVYTILLLLTFGYEYSHAFLPADLFTPLSMSPLIGLIALLVGSGVWIYGRDRMVAARCYGFCLSMSVVFLSLLLWKRGELAFYLLGNLAMQFTVPTLFALLLVVPRTLPRRFHDTDPVSRSLSLRVADIFLLGLLFIDAALSLYLIGWHTLHWLAPQQVSFSRYTVFLTLQMTYYFVGLLGCLLLLLTSYRQSTLRPQLHLFLAGVFASTSPLLLFTIVPSLIGWSGVDGAWTGQAAGLLPIAFGYIVLRHQLLVTDQVIRRVLDWGGRGCWVLLCSLLGWASLSHGFPLPLSILLLVILISLGGFGMKRLARRLVPLPDEALSWWFEEAAGSSAPLQDLLSHLQSVFGAGGSSLFVRDDQVFHPLSPISPEIDHLLHSSGITLPLREASPLIRQISTLARPVIWSELAVSASLARPSARHLLTALPGRADAYLVAPITSHQEVIAFIVLGPHIEYHPYAGPDFDVLGLCLARIAPAVERDRLTRISHQRLTLLSSLYGLAARLMTPSPSEPLPYRLTAGMAHTLQAQVSLWVVGEPPRYYTAEPGRSAVEGTSVNGDPPDHDEMTIIEEHPTRLWLPLRAGEAHVGGLFLSYQQGKTLSVYERDLLQAFAGHIAFLFTKHQEEQDIMLLREQQTDQATKVSLLESLIHQFATLSQERDASTPISTLTTASEIAQFTSPLLPTLQMTREHQQPLARGENIHVLVMNTGPLPVFVADLLSLDPSFQLWPVAGVREVRDHLRALIEEGAGLDLVVLETGFVSTLEGKHLLATLSEWCEKSPLVLSLSFHMHLPEEIRKRYPVVEIDLTNTSLMTLPTRMQQLLWDYLGR